MSRYSVAPIPSTDKYGVFDHALDAFCTLPDDPKAPRPNLLPLEWSNLAGAEAWLFQCYIAWQGGTIPAPEGWRRVPPRPTGNLPAEYADLRRARR
ncbi:hypothetical protein [Streptomyces sp. 16-176A]|uniref:hypothetical protein n=1 Tax=Streptomyces sp. 16-176A TaxID=2530458 RepID=UPI00345CBDC9